MTQQAIAYYFLQNFAKSMIISFSTTAKLASQKQVPDPLLAGIKTVTRRLWTERTAQSVIKAYNEDRRTHQAWSACPRVKGAKKLGDIILSDLPYQEKLSDMPEKDLYHEGDLWLSKSEFYETIKASPNTVVWVVRFHPFKG
jgi:hypothetical protein